VLGYDLSEVLDREPAKWFVRVITNAKNVHAESSAIQMPPLAGAGEGLRAGCPARHERQKAFRAVLLSPGAAAASPRSREQPVEAASLVARLERQEDTAGQ